MVFIVIWPNDSFIRKFRKTYKNWVCYFNFETIIQTGITCKKIP